MKKVDKFLKHIARLEPGSAPSSGYFEEIILEAREAKAEFEALHNGMGVCAVRPSESLIKVRHSLGVSIYTVL